MAQPLHDRYRPKKLDQVRGQDAVVRSLKKSLSSGQHSYLFTGPSGCGKTTLARILLRELGCDEVNLQEIDAATHTGIDAMRSVMETLRYTPMGGSTARGVIVDEAHALSKAAWQSLLKMVEEPPKHVYWALCTTEPNKVPATIRTRCATYALKNLSERELFALAKDVAKQEGLKLDEDILDVVAQFAQGSARQALVGLAQVAGAEDAKDAAVLLGRLGTDSQASWALCQALGRCEKDWSKLVRLVEALKDENPEGVRLQIVAYVTACILGKKSREDAGQLLEVLDAFGEPYPYSNNCAPLLLSLGRYALS